VSNNDRLVDFYYWCPLCEHFELEETEDPCNSCLANGGNVKSTKPIYWKQASEGQLKKRKAAGKA